MLMMPTTRCTTSASVVMISSKSNGPALLLLPPGGLSPVVIVNVVVLVVLVLALPVVDVLLHLVAAPAITRLARTNVGIVTETMTARADVTGIVLAALIIVTVSVILRMSVTTATEGRTVLTAMSANLWTALLPLTRILTSPSKHLVVKIRSPRDLSRASQPILLTGAGFIPSHLTGAMCNIV
jgi:hypothetical protein